MGRYGGVNVGEFNDRKYTIIITVNVQLIVFVDAVLFEHCNGTPPPPPPLVCLYYMASLPLPTSFGWREG